ncbi:hypothetical protein [Taklimakanibacter lacteus]|uniref:hypothetical protein n=1 Tax=Taklimakanibacter lacteus TaxID=2268456 RepID=UPI0013C48DCA
MKNTLKLSTSLAAMAFFGVIGATAVQAADPVVDPGCMLSGSVTAGFMYNWQDAEASDSEDSIDGKDVDWDTPFGEGAGLVTCGGFNVQADVAYYAHSGDLEDISGKDVDLDSTNTHIGGALFWRDPSFAALGVQGSWISQDILSKDVDTFRVGLFGEFYLDDMFTLGGSAAYFNSDSVDTLAGKDTDGFELAAWGRFYATPDFALTLRGDLMLGDFDIDNESGDLNGWAITGDAEYLVWDQGLAIFGGARYAEREADFDDDDLEIEIDDFQVFAGLKFYFGHDGTLLERQRTGTVDNTSVFQEKLPQFFNSALAQFD